MSIHKEMGGKAAALVVVLALLTIGAGGCTSVATEGSIKWLNEWSEALDKARAENKPIMINFYTDICPACTQLDRNTFSDEELGAFLDDNFICLKSNAGKSNLHAKYGISGVPTIVFTAPDGYEKRYEIGRIVGAAPADQFYQGALAALGQRQQ